MNELEKISNSKSDSSDFSLSLKSSEVEKMKLKLVCNDNIDKKLVPQTAKRKILNEDEYVDKIEAIIERDFFPDIPKLRLELEYQDAVEKNDFARIEKLAKAKLEQNLRKEQRQLKTEQELGRIAPEPFETPLENTDSSPRHNHNQNNEDVEPAKKQEIPEKPMSLNSFLNRYTSEDNAAFEQLQQEALEKYHKKMELLSGDVKTHNEKINSLLALPSVETQSILKNGQEDRTGVRLLSWKQSSSINPVMFALEGAKLTKQEELELKTKSGSIVAHENTRLKFNPHQNLLNRNVNAVKAQNFLKQGKIGVDGKEIKANMTPSVNGFKFVPSTPCLAPEDLPGSPLMTWGFIEATPLNIRGDATPIASSIPATSHFRIPEIPEKDVLGHELANRMLASKKKLTNKSFVSTPSSNESRQKSSLERLDSMSSAAQMFATKKLGLHQNMDQSLQASYSPLITSSSSRTPTPRRLITPSPLFDNSSTLTPKKTKIMATSKQNDTKKRPEGTPTSTSSNIIIKRPKASEFF